MKASLDKSIRKALALLCSMAAPACCVHAQAMAAPPALTIAAAQPNAAALHARMLAATHAGARIVAVGDHGVILLSDDGGRTFREARHVPVSSTLTGVSFSDARTGWAVGHWGAILRTTDAGEHWTLQHSDRSVDQPLFSVYFRTREEGWAVGLWSLMLHTTDGGATWSAVPVSPPGAKIARNFYAIFPGAKDTLYVACEQGRVLRSTDAGRHWDTIDTGYAGSFWTGAALPDGTLLVAGLRGTIYRSTDGGDHWQLAKTPFKSSVTALAVRADQSVIAVGLDGIAMSSRDGGATFTGAQRPDRAAFTAVVQGMGKQVVTFTANGPQMQRE